MPDLLASLLARLAALLTPAPTRHEFLPIPVRRDEGMRARRRP